MVAALAVYALSANGLKDAGFISAARPQNCSTQWGQIRITAISGEFISYPISFSDSAKITLMQHYNQLSNRQDTYDEITYVGATQFYARCSKENTDYYYIAAGE